MKKKMVFISIIFSLLNLSCSSNNNIKLNKIKSIAIQRDAFLEKALVLKDYYLVKMGLEIVLFRKNTNELKKTLMLPDSSFTILRATYYADKNVYFLLNRDESKAYKIDTDRVLDTRVITSPLDWYIFIDEKYKEYYRKYKLTGALYNFSQEMSVTKYAYRFDIIHDNDYIYIFLPNSYLKYRLTDLTLESVERFYGKPWYAYNIHGVTDKHYVITSTFIPGVREYPEFYSICSLVENREIKIDYKFINKALQLKGCIFRLSVFNGRIYTFVKEKDEINIYEVSII